MKRLGTGFQQSLETNGTRHLATRAGRSRTWPDSNTYTNSNAHSNPNAYAYSNTYTNSNAHTHPDSIPNAYA